MSDHADPRRVLKELEQRARKRFGQHFLARPSVVTRMVRLANVKPGDRVLEIGPGLGILTEALLAAGADVTAVEVDDDLAARVREVFPTVRLVHQDATTVDWSELCPGEGWKLVANLPYNVGTHLVMALMRRPAPAFESLTCMLQAELVARMAAPPGSRTYGSLSVHLQARAAVRPLFGVPPAAFVPPPRVDSTVIRIEPYHPADLGCDDPAHFDRVVGAAFSQRRKTLRNSLTPLYGRDRAEAALRSVGIDPGLRAEVLDLDAFRQLAGALAT